MMTKILALLVATSTTHAWAEPDSGLERQRAAAVKHEHDAGVRVDYYAKETLIADTDLKTAQITIDMALTQRDLARRANDAKTADYWTKRYRAALADQRDAQERAARFRAERDRARKDFEASAADLRRLRDRG
jgi:hypothetical protein